MLSTRVQPIVYASPTMAHPAFLEIRSQPRGMSRITRQVADALAGEGTVVRRQVVDGLPWC